MKRIQEQFAKQEQTLSIYYTAGYPNLGDTVEIAQALQEAGAGMLEIGMPYSDPVADGPVIQQSSKKALDQGMHLKLLFEQLKPLREQVHIPVLLMGYFNVVLQYGVEAFCKSCAEVGIDGCILPDLPFEEYELKYKPYFDAYRINNVFLVTPQTSEARIRQLDAGTEGFVYLISTSATTGGKMQLEGDTEAYFKRLADMQLRNPLMIGFGIRDKAGFQKACSYAKGAIIGSEFVKVLNAPGDLKQNIKTFIKGILN